MMKPILFPNAPKKIVPLEKAVHDGKHKLVLHFVSRNPDVTIHDVFEALDLPRHSVSQALQSYRQRGFLEITGQKLIKGRMCNVYRVSND